MWVYKKLMNFLKNLKGRDHGETFINVFFLTFGIIIFLIVCLVIIVSIYSLIFHDEKIGGLFSLIGSMIFLIELSMTRQKILSLSRQAPPKICEARTRNALLEGLSKA